MISRSSPCEALRASSRCFEADRSFASHVEKLRLPYTHVVYTVPPYLNVRYPNLGALYAPGGLHILPSLKVKLRPAAVGGHGQRQVGAPNPRALDALERVVSARGDWGKLLGARERLDRLDSSCAKTRGVRSTATSAQSLVSTLASSRNAVGNC